ncbi:hypothetical protein F4776DRAFT_634496 [Hypoxylon sp. NC0597]|nr:hypothetical protein F4776DRAFT_634496 [Hypoxylon sp. NC0597]
MACNCNSAGACSCASSGTCKCEQNCGCTNCPVRTAQPHNSYIRSSSSVLANCSACLEEGLNDYSPYGSKPKSDALLIELIPDKRGTS